MAALVKSNLETEPEKKIVSQENDTQAAYKAFIADSKLHISSLNDGVRFFIRCAIDADISHFGRDWPRALVDGESQVVNAGIWVQNEDTSFELVTIWAVSGTLFTL